MVGVFICGRSHRRSLTAVAGACFIALLGWSVEQTAWAQASAAKQPAAAPAIAWGTNLEQARQTAATQGRPILIHFWNDNCPPCVGVEKNVFSRPEVQRALANGFVPVKIKVSDAPDVAKWFKIERYPVDLVLTADGREIGRSVSPQDPQRYVAMLNQATTLAAPNPATNAPAATPPAAPATPPTPTMAPAPAMSSTNWTRAPAPDSVAHSGGSFSPAGRVATAASVEPAAPNPPLGLEGFCTVTLADKLSWRRGDVRWGVVHRDRTYLFVGPDEQRLFLANPDRYAPMLSGYDPVLFADQGQLVPGSRRHGVWLKQQMFLFADERSLERFRTAPAMFAGRAEEAMRAAAAPTDR